MIFIPIFIFIFYIWGDLLYIRHHRKGLSHVIHISGTRGKTTLVRIVDQMFREAGVKVYSKITGTQAAVRNTKGNELALKRFTPQIREQSRHLIEASKDGADVFITECMALRSESQAYSEALLKADIVLITNQRTDHLESMGFSEKEQGQTLFRITKKKQLILLGEEKLLDFLPSGVEGRVPSVGESFPGEYRDTVNIVFQLADSLGIDRTIARRALETYPKEPGRYRVISHKGNRIFQAFTANDLETTESLYREYASKTEKSILWFNNRVDRPQRTRLFLGWMLMKEPERIFLSGDKIGYCRRYLKNNKFKGSIEQASFSSPGNLDIFGMGNIRGLESLLGKAYV